MPEQQEQQRQTPQVQTTVEDKDGGAWARDRAMIQSEEQPVSPPTTERVKEAARRDRASGEADRSEKG